MLGFKITPKPRKLSDTELGKYGLIWMMCIGAAIL